MARYRSHSIAFKKQVAQEYLGGETLKGLAKLHDISRNLVRLWVAKYEAGEFEEDPASVDRLHEYEARIAALERLVGKLMLENEFLKGEARSRRSARSGTTSIITGPPVSPSREDASS
jgi:transposase